MGQTPVSKEIISHMLDGTISREDVRRLLKLDPKDPDRFFTYLEALQERVPWSDRILIRISEHLYVVRKQDGARVVKCDCGHEFGDYRVNWKLGALVYTRRTLSEMEEVYTPSLACPEPGWQEIREFYCPGCTAQLAVEVVPPGYPLVFEFLPDIDALYRQLGRPLPDERADWFRDRSADLLSGWSQGRE